MRKNRNRGNKAPSSYLNDGIHVSNYPYYRRIPIEHIAQKQEQYLSKSHTTIVPDYGVTTELPLSTNQYIDIETTVQEIPKSNNVEFTNTDTIYEEIAKCTERLALQQRQIISNQIMIEDQLKQINEKKTISEQQGVAIHHNSNLINQQIQVYNHNVASIHSKEQQLYNLNYHIQEASSKLEELQQQITTHEEQIAYHTQMLGAFNTMVQNPDYFTQLMAFTMNAFPPPTPVDDVDTV